MNDFYLSCHTIGTGPTAPIIAIACVAFDPVEGKIGAHTYIEIDLAVLLRPAFLIDPESLGTWMGRSEQARMAFVKKPSVTRYSLQTALDELQKWIGSHANEAPHAWGDLAVLEYAYRVGGVGLHTPWHATGRRESRSILDLCQTLFKMPEQDNAKPNILDNLVAQATHNATQICEMYAFLSKLKSSKPTKPAKPAAAQPVDDDEI